MKKTDNKTWIKGNSDKGESKRTNMVENGVKKLET